MADALDEPRWRLEARPASVVVEVPRQEMAAEDAERLGYQILRAVREARAMGRERR